MTPAEIIAAINAMTKQAYDVEHHLKQLVRSMVDDDGDLYYATATLLDRICNIASALDDADNAAPKIDPAAVLAATPVDNADTSGPVGPVSPFSAHVAQRFLEGNL